MSEPRELAIGLVFAIAHEIGNHLGGIRLQAHLIDEDLDARSLADASIVIDGMAGQSGGLLTLIRPLLSEDWRASAAETWSNLLGRVRQQIEDEGTRGVRLQVGPLADASLEAPDFEWLQPLLVALVSSTMTHLGHRGSVVLRLEPKGSESVLVLEDDGAEEDLSKGAANRGRPLVLAIARELIGRADGRVYAFRGTDTRSDRTRVELVFSKDR